ncbi:MAG: hypothetical protein IJM30_06000 [Thermoguttaceae bacterium]|nr:hypothetical protein [Thermoguttaceae bacterium]
MPSNNSNESAYTLDDAASYLRGVVNDDLYGPLRDNLEALLDKYENENPKSDRERFWEDIRRALRGLEGYFSESYDETFRRFARKRFDRIWGTLTFDERSLATAEFKFDPFGDERIVRKNFLAARREALKQLKRRIENVFGTYSTEMKQRLVARSSDDPDVAFMMCEYVYALDDFECNAEAEEPQRLLDALMDAIRGFFFPPKTEESAGDGSASESDGADSANASPDAAVENGSETLDELSEEPPKTEKDAKPGGYYPVDEGLAEAAKRAISFDDYVPNSETELYRREVDKARRYVDLVKKRADQRHWDRIDQALDRFERNLANWYDKRNKVESYCPSILISGSGGFPTARHNKKMERLGALYKERDEIFDGLQKIESIGTGGINSDDPDALEQLQAKLQRIVDERERMKRANAYLRRCGTWEGYDDPEFVSSAYDQDGQPKYFYLTGCNLEIRRLEGRITILKRQAATDYGDGWPFEGGIAKVDKAENRLQIFFNSIPDEEVRARLKERGFHWAPRNKAWQRKLSPDAIWAGKYLGYIPKDWKPVLIEPVD